MDIKKCKIFVLTTETENISKTADLTGYTQSAISHMLKSMEKETGIELFVRDRYGVHPTPVARELLPHINALLNENEKVEQFIYDLHGLEVGSLTIGTFSSIALHLIPDILQQFAASHPNIAISIREGGSDDMEHWTADNEVDFCLYSKNQNSPLQFFPLMEDPIMAILPPDFPLLQNQTSVPIRIFDKRPFIISQAGIEYDVHRAINEAGITPNVRFSSKDDKTILAMVQRGLGAALLPRLTTEDAPEGVQVLPLDPERSRTLGIGIKNTKNAAPIVKLFIRYILNHFQADIPDPFN